MSQRKPAYIFFLVGLVFICFVSCSIEKRIYRKGYHVVWNHKKIEQPKKAEEIKPEQMASHANVDSQELLVYVTNEKDLEIVSLSNKPSFVLGKDTCGDIALFKSGDKLNVKVIEVTNDKIKYRRCDNLDGPLFSVNKRSLAKLTYYNGIEEDLTVVEEVKVPKEKPVQKKETNGLGVASFICSLFGWFFGIPLIFAIPMAIGSLSQFKKYPDKYEIRGFPIAALVISLIISLLFAFVFYLAAYSAVVSLGFSIFFGALALFSLIGLLVYA